MWDLFQACKAGSQKSVVVIHHTNRLKGKKKKITSVKKKYLGKAENLLIIRTKKQKLSENYRGQISQDYREHLQRTCI